MDKDATAAAAAAAVKKDVTDVTDNKVVKSSVVVAVGGLKDGGHKDTGGGGGGSTTHGMRDSNTSVSSITLTPDVSAEYLNEEMLAVPPPDGLDNGGVLTTVVLDIRPPKTA